MKNKTIRYHYPPSYYRYQENNPVITIRLTKKLREELDKVKGELTYAEVIRKMIRKDFSDLYEKAFNEGSKKGYDYGVAEGYQKGKEDWRIWYYCDVCGERMYISPNSEAHKDIINYMKKAGWGHVKCHEKRRRGEI